MTKEQDEETQNGRQDNTAEGMGEEMEQQKKTISVAALPQVRVLGRTTGKDTVNLFWTGSGIEMIYTGSELWVEVNANYDTFEPWLAVELNGALISRFPVNKGKNEICLFRGMTAGKPKHIRILKEVQAMNEDPAHMVQILGLQYGDGEFLPLQEPKYRLEFVGDSITSGEGTVGAAYEEDWISAFFSAINTYPRMVSDALSAEYRVVSQSGWGIVTGWDGNVQNKIPPFYTQVCGLLTGEGNASLGALEDYDFKAWQPDAVFINLGTNDATAIQSAAELGQEWAGTRDIKEVKEILTTAIRDFLKVVRTCNPGAQILWGYGMLGDNLLPLIREAVENYAKETADARIHFLQLPDTTPDTVGSRLHPGVKAHRNAARVIEEYLKKILV